MKKTKWIRILTGPTKTETNGRQDVERKKITHEMVSWVMTNDVTEMHICHTCVRVSRLKLNPQPNRDKKNVERQIEKYSAKIKAEKTAVKSST